MDWVLSGLVILGNYLIGRKNKWGWVAFTVASILWVFYALWILDPPQYGLVPAAAINLVIGVSSGVRWFKDEKYAKADR